jgi:hypothetical protein
MDRNKIGGNMEDINQPGETPQEEVQQDGKTVDDIVQKDSLESRLAALEEQLTQSRQREDKFKREVDRRNTEIQKQKKREEALIAEKMTEEEKLRYKLEQDQKQLEEERAKFRAEKLKNTKLKLITEKQIDVRFEDFLIGEDEESLTSNTDMLLKIIEDEVNKRVNQRLTSNTNPKTGAPIKDKTKSDKFDAALVNKNFASALHQIGQNRLADK